MLFRLLERVRVDEAGCWLWTGYRLPNGYGRISDGPEKLYTHRAMWEAVHGRPLPDGLVVDHLCRVHHCMNPDHIEAVTPRTNVMRGFHPNVMRHRMGLCRACRAA